MRHFYSFILVMITAFSAYSQESTAFKNYLRKVKSPVYLDLQAGVSPFTFQYDLTRFANLSGGVQITRRLGVGVDLIQGRLGGAYDFMPFEGKGVQLRYTTHRWIVKGTFGRIDAADRIDDSFYEYEYIPTKNDTYWRIDTGIRFWKIVGLGMSVTDLRNMTFDLFEYDFVTNDRTYFDRSILRRRGFTFTLSVLLPPFGKKK